jgi:protocatechuate 3,4-dioxygenase beta subunit
VPTHSAPERGHISGRRAAGLLAAFAAIAALVLSSVMVPALSADAATFTLTATRASSGTAAADASSSCPTQGSPADAHCAGYDVSLAATDQILRTGDTANVRFDFAFDGADTGVVLRSTLPVANGGAAATWTAIPAACAAGSTRTDGNRTLNCLIANPQGPGDGSVTATMRLEPLAYDGYTFTVPATIDSAASGAVTAASTATFTSSSAPLWELTKNSIANVQPAPAFYRGPGGEPGFAFASSTLISASKVGGYSPLAGTVTWTETATSPGIDMTDYRLLTWGNYGQDGCSADGTAALPAVPGYTSTGIRVSNQYSAVTAGQFDCVQAAPGAPVQITWSNLPAAPAQRAGNVWMMLWVPLTAIPLGTTPAPRLTASDFDPDDVNGVSNFFGGTENTANNGGVHGNIVNADNRTVGKRPITDGANPYAVAFPGADSSTLRDESFASLVLFTNTGTVLQTPLQLCDVFDVTTQRLSPFAANANVPADTYVVATTNGPVGDPITAPPYNPGAGYNNTNNFRVDPSAYIVEYAAGDLGTGTPAEAPAPTTAFEGVTCADGATATGWHTDPNAAAITAYATSLGLSSPFDVINRVRVTFVGGAVQPGQAVAIKVHTTTRDVYRAATTQAGQMIFATTRIGDVATYDYPQISIAPWTQTAYAGPTVSGRIDVNTAVDIVNVTPTSVQAGAPGQNRATFTLRASVAFGENVATTQPLRVVHRLPAGMRYITGSASLTPDHVLPQADGSTIIVWDLGDITGTTNGVTTTPDWTFVAEADPLAPTPSVNWSTAISESVSPTGVQIDQDLPIVSCGSFLDVTIPPTPNVPVQTVTQLPPANDYSGCFGQGRNRRMDYQGVTIGNAFLSLAALKTALQPLVESGADDGTAGAEVGWELVYRNTTSNTFPGVDIVDVLPYPGDGRDPESDFAGTIGLSSIGLSDAVSVTPNALPVSPTVQGPRAGTTIYLTARAAAQVENDPYAPSNLQGGATRWCLLSELGDPGCPADMSQATALRLISGALATGEEESVRIGLATDGAAAGDIMTNTATARIISVLTPVDIAGDSIEFEASSVAGTVWRDADADGVIGAGETVRYPGVSVRITGTATTSGESVDRTVTTAADGSYRFAGLPAGSYTVTVDQASVRAIDAALGLTSDPDGLGAAADGSFAVTLALGTDITSRDFGFASSSLAGVVFGDDDNDGAVDAGESGISGVTVTLTGTDDLGATVSRTATTDSSGAYTMSGLRPGSYQLTVTPPAGRFGGQNVPGTAGGTGGAVGSNQVTAITLGAGQNGTGYRFGILEPEIIEGIVYEDTNDNGVRDPGEPGIEGVTLTLSGDADLVTETIADGRFIFAGLAPGDYTVTQTQPVGYASGVTATNGSSGTVTGDVIAGIVVGDPQPTDSYSFGEVPLASIRGVVYDDLDGDGVRDPGEPGIAGAQVSLSGDATQGPVTTGADGSFRFDGLQPGEYVLTQSEAAGYLDAFETAGSAGGTIIAPNRIEQIVVAPGQLAAGYLFGDVRPASLSGVVFVDTDGDGVQDAGETGIPGVDITLTGTDLFGAPVATTATTAFGGTYSFAGLLPGTYVIAEAQPSGYFDGADAAGSAGGTVGADVISDIVLGSGTTATGYLFAERAAVSIGGTVFADLDGDGVQDAGELGIAGVTIDLTGPSGPDSTVTGADGSWSFTSLPPGTYAVSQAGQPLSGYADGSSVPGTAGGTAALNAITGIPLTAAADGYDFAEIPLSIIRGMVWHDADDDGVVDVGEAPIAGVEVTLGGTESRTAVTDASGAFVFGGLAAGTYTLTEQDLANWSDGATLVGTSGGTAGVNTVTGIVLGAGVDASGYGFGERAAELQLTVSAQTLDAQLATGPYVAVGDTVRFLYAVSNNGDTSIDGIEIVDDVLGPVVCPSDQLAPHTSMVCELDAPAEAGQQLHTGSASASVVPSSAGGGSAAAVTALAASDVAHYFGALATAEISATVNGDSSTTSPGPVFTSGTSLAVVVTITNTGNVPLALGTLDSGTFGPLDCGATAQLLPGESVDCVATRSPAAGNYVFPFAMTLAGPAATDIDGNPVAVSALAATTLFFQVLEPGVRPPAVALTGATIDAGAIALAVLALLVGAGLVTIVVIRRRRSSREA